MKGDRYGPGCLDLGKVAYEFLGMLAGDGHATIEVKPFNSLLMSFAEDVGAQMIIRGLRAVSDFEYEFQMVGMNMRLNPDIETVFLMAEPTQQAIASRLVKEIAMLGGNISPFLSPYVAKKLKERGKELRPPQKAARGRRK